MDGSKKARDILWDGACARFDSLQVLDARRFLSIEIHVFISLRAEK